MLTREDIAFMYLEQLPFEPHPFQEEAILERWGYSKHYVGLVTGNRTTLHLNLEVLDNFFYTLSNRRENPDLSFSLV